MQKWTDRAKKCVPYLFLINKASYGLIIYFPKKHVIPSFEALYSA